MQYLKMSTRFGSSSLLPTKREREAPPTNVVRSCLASVCIFKSIFFFLLFDLVCYVYILAGKLDIN